MKFTFVVASIILCYFADAQHLRKRELNACSSYVASPGCSTNINYWDNGGGADSEWMNTANWANCLPGVSKYNRVIMAVNDVATVHCAATYASGGFGFEIEMRSGATLDAAADMDIAGQLVLKTNAMLVQSSDSVFTVGGRLYLAAKLHLFDSALMNVASYAYVPSNGELELRSAAQVTAHSVPFESQFHGIMRFVFSSHETGLFQNSGNLQLGGLARLEVDVTAYDTSSGSLRAKLVGYDSVTGSFSDVNIIDGQGRVANIITEADGIYLELAQAVGQTPAPVAPPTPAPVEPVTPPPTTAPIEPVTPPPTATPVTPPPTATPTSPPTTSPVEPVTPPPTATPVTPPPTATPVTPPPTTAPVEPVTPPPTATPVTPPPTATPVTPPPTAVPVTPPPTAAPVEADILSTIADADGYSLVYELDPIPTNPTYANGVSYTQYNLNHPSFTRVAYFMELEGAEFGQQWVWVSMDTFTNDVSHTGVPCPVCGQGNIQTTVTNVNVASNVPNLVGTGLGGNIEFWPTNYLQENGDNIEQASDSTFDTGDTAGTARGPMGPCKFM